MRLVLPLILAFCLAACVVPGQSVYLNDPLTGGRDSGTSQLLHIPLPASLQYYPSHSKIEGGGRKEGLEVLRGHVDQDSCLAYFQTQLRQAGWQLRMRERAGDRAIQVYQKDNELVALTFHAQGMLTIVQIWAGPRFADNAISDFPEASQEPLISLPGETFGPAGSESGISEHAL